MAVKTGKKRRKKAYQHDCTSHARRLHIHHIILPGFSAYPSLFVGCTLLMYTNIFIQPFDASHGSRLHHPYNKLNFTDCKHTLDETSINTSYVPVSYRNNNTLFLIPTTIKTTTSPIHNNQEKNLLLSVLSPIRQRYWFKLAGSMRSLWILFNVLVFLSLRSHHRKLTA